MSQAHRLPAGPSRSRPVESSRARRSARHWLVPALLLVAVLAAYLPALRAGYIWDDDSYVTGNETLRSLDGLRRIWTDVGATKQYYPLVHTSFWVEYRLWRLAPSGFHLTNALLHALNAILVWLLLRRLCVPGATLAAVIFALHPVHVESVAWITERKNVLSGAFYLGSLLAYLRFVPPVPQNAALPSKTVTDSGSGRGRRRFLLVALALYGAALLSKTVTVTLPAAILLVIYWKRGRIAGRDLVPLVPFLVLGAALGSVTIWMERHVVGAEGESWDLSFLERVVIAGRALWFYAGKLVWPADLTFIYPRWKIDTATISQLTYPAAALAVLALLVALRRRWGRGPLVAALFFAVTLTPALGFFDVYPFRFSFVADHFQYLASLGVIAGAAAGLTLAWHRLAPRPTPVAALPVIILGTALGVLTWRQSHAYADEETLWEDTLRKDPDSWMAHLNLGVLLSGVGRTADAYDHFAEALRVKPEYAEGWNNLGVAAERLGRTEEAVRHYLTSLGLDPENANVGLNLANVLAVRGQNGPAMEAYRRVIALDPEIASAHGNLGVLLLGAGRTDEAIASLARAIQLDPGFTRAWIALGMAREQNAETDAAIDAYRRALELDPSRTEIATRLTGLLERTGDAAAPRR